MCSVGTSTEAQHALPAWTKRPSEEVSLEARSGQSLGIFLRYDLPRRSVLVLRCVPSLSQSADLRCLRVGDRGHVSFRGQGGPYAQLSWESRDAEGFGKLFCARSARFLAVGEGEKLVGVQGVSEASEFSLKAVLATVPRPPCHASLEDSAVLTSDQLRNFEGDGFLVIPRVCPLEVCLEARRRINSELLTPRSDETGKDKICPESSVSSELLALLYSTPLWTYVKCLLGDAQLVAGCQVAVRAPQQDPPFRVNGLTADIESDAAARELRPTRWHIDGMGQGKHSPFSLLVGVALSAQRVPFSGNLIVFPSSHKVLQPLLREQVEAGSGLFSEELDGSKPALTNPTHVLLDVGDVVLCHQKTAHRVGPNFSPDLRYQVYFRVRHSNHAQLVEDGTLLRHGELFAEFEGVK